MRSIFLLGSSLLALAVGQAARAGTPTVADNFTVVIGGEVRFSYIWFSQDQPTQDAGFTLRTDEAEVRFEAKGRTRDGLGYGFEIEMQVQTDDTLNADEMWMYVDTAWGRIELGDQDDAADRMFVAGEDVMKGRGGYDGAVPDVFVQTGVFGIDTTPVITLTDDSTKVTYFSPRFSGLQFGASFTPDVGQNGGAAANDGNGDFESVYSFGLNYAREVGDVDFIIAGVYSHGASEDPTVEDLDIWGLGAVLNYGDFQVGAGYSDHGRTGLTTPTGGADAGQWWNVAFAYTMDDWAFSVGYFQGWAENTPGTRDSTIDVLSFAVTYSVAPGWDIKADLNLVDVETVNRVAGSNNDGHVFVLSSVLTF